ncbi:MAG: Gfo/Idh/MocA family oxidoreductase [Planctomycetes bacterium]|nr:Gfo/Idh/MocA family oxidoreductase [Planctomycetota bacterium]
MNRVRLGIVGLGNMGSWHCKTILDGNQPRLELAAICDTDPAKMTTYPEGVRRFADAGAMIRSGAIDAILIAVPHYFHTTIGIDAIEQGLHVLVEKPISVHKADCERLIAAYEHRPKAGQVFAAMFNQRTDPHYIKLKRLIESGELGEIRRITWIMTDWFRTGAYYASGGWRATWGGEGGGTLLNQCPHNLDLWQWLFGMPTAVHAHCGFGQWHDIEVEDQVNAHFTYGTRATGTFIATTGESPGTNRLEIAAEMGSVVVEDGRLRWQRNAVGMSEFCRTTPVVWSKPDSHEVVIAIDGHGPQHNGVLANFAEAVLDGAALIAPASEGIRSVELANAMIWSGWTGQTARLPLDGAAYEARLKRAIAESRHTKPAARAGGGDFANSFGGTR